MPANELFGALVMVVATLVFPALLIYGLVAGRVLNPPGADLFRIAADKAAGEPPPPLMVDKQTLPGAYWRAIGLYAAMTLCCAFLVYAVFFLQPVR